jgi:hypothetical protein
MIIILTGLLIMIKNAIYRLLLYCKRPNQKENVEGSMVMFVSSVVP